ncbi:hypothetical protein UVI_02049400 [Ustilaginoidea virens]|nr:hypothetical protein UVI_02049400 [Ustilaginoidea virens]
MEYIPLGDLGKTISEDGTFTMEMTQTMSVQLLSALGYLHANNITHRDVKPDNILIQSLEPLVVKLTDFGLSKMVDTAETFLRTFCGTLLYCAPEVYTEYAEYDDNGVRNRGQRMRRMPGQRYSHAVDIWSLGGVLFYCLSGSPPYPVKSGISYSELLHKIMTTNLDTAPLRKSGVTDLAIDFIKGMLHRRPERRATIPELEGHPWLGGFESVIQASQSYDEITDDEDYPSQLQNLAYADDRVSDSMSDMSDKENSLIAHNTQHPRLFGEVGVSAIGSSGAIPDDFLEMVAADSLGATDILGPCEDEAYDSAASDTIQGGNQRASRRSGTSIYPNQSVDQLQSLVEDVASQSLGGSVENAQEPGSLRLLSHSVDANSSKRKPPSNDASGEFDENTPPGKPVMKRLKSEGNLEEVPNQLLEEYRLLARMPQVMRLESGRLIDHPVSKMEFWEQDKNTWHLNYPEMTQLQHDAFKQAAKDGGEEFWPGKTPLWDLAMKYFPPLTRAGGRHDCSTEAPSLFSRRDGSKNLGDATTECPPTAAPTESSPLPDTCPPDAKIVVPVQEDPSTNRALALVVTDASSCVQGISFAVTDNLVSFGRGPDNTEIFRDKQEPRVPKYAFKILLWKEGYDPSRSSSKGDQPWCKQGANEHDAAYHFWISTKATLGIKINGYSLASSEPKNPSGPSQYWARIYNGDSLTIWGGQGALDKTRLVFQCLWGGSSKPRPKDHQRLALASAQTAAKLDAACQRTEKRIREAAEKKRRSLEARTEFDQRKRHVDRERERSRVFEDKRREAVAYLAARQTLGSRGASSAPATTHASSGLHAGSHLPRMTSPDKPAPHANW